MTDRHSKVKTSRYPGFLYSTELILRNNVLKASELKTGAVVEINGVAHLVRQIEVRNPSSRGASTLYKIRFTNLKS